MQELQERAENQAKSNANLTSLSYQPGNQVPVHSPYTGADSPNPNVVSPWRCVLAYLVMQLDVAGKARRWLR